MNPQKKIYGLIGYPVKHSLSPLMHNAAFRAFKINAEYRLFEVEPAKLEAFLLDNIKVLDTQGEEFYSQNIIGFNITIPYKIRAKEILEKKFSLSLGEYPEQDLYYVKLSGAINTVKREGKQLLYCNTDAWGFLKSLEDKKEEGWGLGFESKGKSALVIGSGGAGRAVVAALSWKNMEMENIYINDIDEHVLEATKGYFLGLGREDLKERLEFIPSNNIPSVIEKCDLLVNASSVGMKEGDPCVINRDLLHKRLSVYDVVYNTETELVKEALAKGIPAVRGLGMLLYQGAAAFLYWTGMPAPIEVMKQALKEGVKKV